MTNQNDSDGSLERPVFCAEDGPDVEGHLRPGHAAREVFGPDGPAEARPSAHDQAPEQDGPDVEGHFWPR